MGGRGATSSQAGGGSGGRGNKKLREFQRMNGEQLDDLANELRLRPRSYCLNQGLNPDNATQRLVEELGMNDKPTVLSNEAYDKIIQNNPGIIQIYRGVEDNGSMSADDIRNHMLMSDKTYIGDGIHGEGLYFSTSQRTANIYAGYGGAVTQGFIDPAKAKTVDENDLYRMASRDPINTVDRFRNISEYAIYKGYNCIVARGGNGTQTHADGGEDFYIPLDRSIIVARKDTQPLR